MAGDSCLIYDLPVSPAIAITCDVYCRRTFHSGCVNVSVDLLPFLPKAHGDVNTVYLQILKLLSLKGLKEIAPHLWILFLVNLKS